MKRSLLCAGLFCLFAGQAVAQRIVGRDQSTFSVDEALSRGDWVRIATPNGSIRITEGSGNRVEIQAEKSVRRGSIRDVGFVVRRDGGGVTVCAVYDDDDECREDGSYRRNERSRRSSNSPQVRVDFTVRIPTGARVRAGSGNGNVSVVGGGAEVIAASGNGRVDVTDPRGEVRASTGNGSVTVSGAAGPVNASTGSGPIRITTSTGPVSASSGNGSIDVSMDRLTGSGDMRFSTGNGRIVVRVPDGFGAEFESSTGNGDVVVDFPIRMQGRVSPRRIRGTIGNGGGRLVMSSGNGDLELRRRP